ncbi:MAG: class I poly(R)-hydroxyalkanoic acid synthase, partial [Paracoccus sp. (in: a-proteobacteria)]|nr:class I poly(R)-hydroxyalkanoic acid synthase [Paracoccus sp. (in: a-proteobacteria)]
MASEDTPKMQGRGTNAAPQRRAGAKPAATGSDKKPAKAAKPAQDPAKAAAKPATRRVKAADKPAEVDVAAGAPKARAKAAGSTAKGATKPASRPARSTAKPRKAAAATAKKPVAKASGNAPAPARSLADLADGMARDAAVARMPAAPKPAPKPAATPAPTPAPEAGAGQPQEEPARASSPFAENLERIEALTQRLASALSRRTIHDPGIEGPGADLMVNAGMAMARLWAGQPAKILEQQVKYWGATFAHYAEMQSHLARGKLTVPPDDTPETDKRFKNPLWQSHPFFNMIKTQYQINSKAMRDAASGLDMENEVDQHRLGWLTNQVIDMFAPTNFFATNPDAIERALETEGESLVKGLENLVRDIEANKGDLVVSLADRNAFAVGENIGTAPGRVVRRERLFELIQFSPSTDQVHETPVILFPPWINKFYILDLKPENSLIRWIVDQGYTLFVLSWKNPDTSYAETSLEDYVSAYLSAMDAVLEITGQPRLNAVGYCIGGTTLGL